MIVNNTEKGKTVLSKMEQWSILTNVVIYVQYDKHPRNFHSLNVSTINKENYKRNLKSEEKQSQKLDLDFDDTLEKLKREHLDVYEGIQLEILSTTKFEENSDLSTTYLGNIDVIKDSKVKVEGSFPISEQGYMIGKLLDGKECQLLLNTGVSKSFMSKSHYLCCKLLHSLPKFVSRTQRIQPGNRLFVSVLFIIPIIIDIHGHRFEIYTLVSEIHENVDLVLGIKNIFELEGIINSLGCCFNFLNRSYQFFQENA